MKINIGTGFKNYSHKYRATNNTTANFGEVQPLMCRMMLAKSSINVDLKQFVRLMPMPYPTFGHVSLKNIAKFVPIGDIYEPFDSFLSGLPHKLTTTSSSIIPKKLPYVTNQILQACLLSKGYAEFSLWTSIYAKVGQGPFNPEEWEQPEFSDNQAVPTECSYKYLTPADQIRKSSNAISIDGADYVFIKQPSETHMVYYAFRYTPKGKRLRKVLLGLGYNPCYEDTTPVCALPLFAFYKAYFETFNPHRTLNYQDTIFFGLTKYIAENSVFLNGSQTIFDISAETTTKILDALSDVYATDNTDWVSLHTTDLLNQTSGIAPNTTDNAQIGDSRFNTDAGQLPVIIPSDKTQDGSYLTQANLDLLKRITSLFTKESILGKRVESWIKNKYGAEISNQIYSTSSSCGSNVVDITISDVDSLADTAIQGTVDKPSTGSVLGSYAGKGIGSGDGQFSYKTDVHGYFIILSYLVPDEGYFQGTDPTLCALLNSEIPTPVYDAIGYELTPRTCLWTDNDISTNIAVGTKNALITTEPINGSDSFGYLPRYSGFKHIKNIVNGDLSRRGTLTDMQCFYLDKMFIHRGIHDSAFKQIHHIIMPFANELPKASESWRYISKYPFLQNYNRIFYNYDGESNVGWYKSVPNLDDNFIIHSALSITENNSLKPIRESYDTFIDNVNTGDADVQSV